MKIKHSAPSTALGNVNDWDKFPFRLAGIEIDPDKLSDTEAMNLSRVVETTYKLYSDPWLAVVREYLSNAKDIHRRIGSTTPIEVFLPTPFQQEFVIRDFGTGLDEDGMLYRFGSYGSSDKNETNDENGAFGIGCKCGFRVTPNFTVVNYQPNENGVMTKTVWHLTNDEGIGALYRLKEIFEVPGERAGLEIRIPCNSDESQDLQSRLQSFLGLFDHEVVVHNKPDDWCVEVPEYNFDGGSFTVDSDEESPTASWKLRKNHSGSRIITGGVCYDIEPYRLLRLSQPSLDDTEAHERWKRCQKLMSSLNTLGVDIWIDVGGVDLARTREELDYNRRLSNVLEEVVWKLSKDAEVRFNNLTKEKIEGDGIDLRKFIHDFKDTRNQFAKLMGVDSVKLPTLYSTTGATARSSSLYLSSFNHHAKECDMFDSRSVWVAEHINKHSTPHMFFTVYRFDWSDRSNKVYVRKDVDIDTVPIRTGNEIFIFNDTGRERYNPWVWGVVKEAVEEFKQKKSDGQPFVVIELDGEEEDALRMLDFYGIDRSRLQYLSQFEKYNPYPYQRSGSGSGRSPLSRYYTLSSSHLPRSRTHRQDYYDYIPADVMWDRETTPFNVDEISISDDKIVVKVPLIRGKWVRTDEFKSTQRCTNVQLRNIINYLASMTQKTIVVYGFSVKNYDGVDLPTLETTIRETLKNETSRFQKTRNEIVRHHIAKDLMSDIPNCLRTDLAGVVLGDQMERFQFDSEKYYQLVDAYNNLNKLAGIVKDIDTDEFRIWEECHKIAARKIGNLHRKWAKKVQKVIARRPLLHYVVDAPKELLLQHIHNPKTIGSNK